MAWVAVCAARAPIGALGIAAGCSFVMPSIVGEALHHFGSEEQKQRYLKPMLEGKLASAPLDADLWDAWLQTLWQLTPRRRVAQALLALAERHRASRHVGKILDLCRARDQREAIHFDVHRGRIEEPVRIGFGGVHPNQASSGKQERKSNHDSRQANDAKQQSKHDPPFYASSHPA